MTSAAPPGAFDKWMADLEARHMADLRFSDVVSGLRALSSTYVERRARLERRGSLDSRGKRAAFALSYGPRHFLLLQALAAELPGAAEAASIVDLGCGTGAAGAGWAASCDTRPRIFGIDGHPWAVAEAALTYRQFAAASRAVRGDMTTVRLPRGTDAVVAAFAANELGAEPRARLLSHLIAAHSAGAAVLIVEPLSTRAVPWWPEWAEAARRRGGRADTWRLPAPLPELTARLDEAAGLATRELTARTIWLPR